MLLKVAEKGGGGDMHGGVYLIVLCLYTYFLCFFFFMALVACVWSRCHFRHFHHHLLLSLPPSSSPLSASSPFITTNAATATICNFAYSLQLLFSYCVVEYLHLFYIRETEGSVYNYRRSNKNSNNNSKSKKTTITKKNT